MPGPPFDYTANAAKLRGCRGPHRFAELPGQANFFREFRIFRCSNCGGEVDGHTIAWYAKGMEHSIMLGGDRCKL